MGSISEGVKSILEKILQARGWTFTLVWKQPACDERFFVLS